LQLDEAKGIIFWAKKLKKPSNRDGLLGFFDAFLVLLTHSLTKNRCYLSFPSSNAMIFAK
jgi:hypothetical protein